MVEVQRPWGSFKIVEIGEDYWVKILTLNPKARISLQSHENRNERWVVLTGFAFVECIEDEKASDCDLEEGDSIYIPKGVTHRVTNLEKITPLIILETAHGVCDEEDITRYEDDYGRAD